MPFEYPVLTASEMDEFLQSGRYLDNWMARVNRYKIDMTDEEAASVRSELVSMSRRCLNLELAINNRRFQLAERASEEAQR
jgi:hypothetical protein